jgi:peptidoglycan/LPS O-acetylase OafA/YrhL
LGPSADKALLRRIAVDIFMSTHSNRFDVLRLFAAWLVLFSHAYVLAGRGHQEPWVRWVGVDSLGGLGVAVFFALSGYLVTCAWERNPNVWRFARNRALRIYPALVVVTLLSAMVMGPVLTTLPLLRYLSDSATLQFMGNATAWYISYALPGVFGPPNPLSAVNGSLWSLPYELRCYMVLALVAWLPGGLRYKLIGLVFGLVVALVLHPLALDPFAPHAGLSFMDLKLGLFFGIGALMASWRHRVAPHWAVGVSCLLAATVASGQWRVLLLLWGVVTLVLWLALYGRRCLPRWPSRWGDWSYGCYLYAFPVQQWLVAQGWHERSFALFVLLSTLLALGCGAASWHGIERWAARLKA